MSNSYQVSLFNDGLNQVLTIPSELSLPSTEVMLRREGNRLIVESLSPGSLISVLAGLTALSDNFPDVDEGLLPLDEIVL